MSIALITLSPQGAKLAARIAAELADCEVFVHSGTGVSPSDDGTPVPQKPHVFESVCDLTAEIFARYAGLVYILPTGVAVRAIAPHAKHKTTDPAVVAMDVGGRWAVSLLSGHEGGANDLAVAVANAVGAEPVISTTTEAVKDILIGVGCRRGVTAEAIVAAVEAALKLAGVGLGRVRLIASADIKKDEAGLIEAARRLGVPLRFIESREIRLCPRAFAPSALAQEKVSLPAVAEPCALLAGRRTELILPRQKTNGVTVALAREDCWSLG